MRKEKQNKNENVLFISVLVCVTLFAALTVFPGLEYGGLILEWDEARHGINAYEMLRSKNFIVNTFQYSLDYWNTKPPFSMWVIILGYKLFGFNVFGLRFFSALCLPVAVFFTVLILNKHVGIISAAVCGILLAVCGGRLPHLFTTGDPDALLFLFCLLTCLFLYSASKGKAFYLIGAGISTALAFLTKSMHVVSLFFVLAVFLAWAFRKRVFSFRRILTGLVLPMAVPVIFWAALRFSYEGLEFFKRMIIADVFDRVTSVVEGHAGGGAFYSDVYKNFIGAPLIVFFILLAAFWIFDRFSEKYLGKNKKLPALDVPFILIFSAMAVGPFIIFTIPATKIAWYIYPSLIGFCFIAGYAAQSLFLRINAKKGNASRIIYVCGLAVCLFYCRLTKPLPEPAASYTTNVNSGGNIFEAAEIESGAKYIAVDSNGTQTNSLNSWLLQSYFCGMEYVPGGMERVGEDEPLLVALRCGSEAELNYFFENHPGFEIIGQTAEYTGAVWVLLK